MLVAPFALVFGMPIGGALAMPRRLAQARLAGVPASNATAHVTITLGLRRQAELRQLLAAQQDPASPLYHQWLSPEAFADRFAPSLAEYENVAGWLSSSGVEVRRFANRLRLDVFGDVATVETLLQVRMQHFALGDRMVMASPDTPTLPSTMTGLIEHVRLDNAPLARPIVRVNTTIGSLNVLGPADLYLAYNMTPLLAAGTDGSGQKIAIVARADFKIADVNRFRQQFGLTAVPPVKVFPGTNPGIGAIRGVCADLHDPRAQQICVQGEEGEVLLDAQWAGAAAPGAEVLVDISDSDIDASLADIVAHHADAKLIGMSFGVCERLDAGESQPLFFPLYLQAAAQGQTIFVSSGDDGADGCQDGKAAGVSVLASDPNVTSVGGTTLDPGFDPQGNATAYVGEGVWNDKSGASGGGVSTVVERPFFQSGAGIAPGTMRLQPDVALAGSPGAPGFALIFEGSTVVVGGTSVGTPIWAGMAALLAQHSGDSGLGPLNPSLYKFGRKQHIFGAAPVFHDVTAGNNRFNGVSGFSAQPGYDETTGLGSPDVAALAGALVECAGDCNGDAAVTVDEILLAVNIALENEPYPRCGAADVDADGTVGVNEIIAAVDRALAGCR